MLNRTIFVKLRNKFDLLVEIIINNIEVLLMLETKTYSYFPKAQVVIQDYLITYRLNRTTNDGGILLHIREDFCEDFCDLCVKFYD